MGSVDRLEALATAIDRALDGWDEVDEVLRALAGLEPAEGAEAYAAARAVDRILQRLPEADVHPPWAAAVRAALIDGRAAAVAAQRAEEVRQAAARLRPQQVAVRLLRAACGAPGASQRSLREAVWPGGIPSTAESTLSRNADRLEREGLVLRERLGRSNELRPTAFGREVSAWLLEDDAQRGGSVDVASDLAPIPVVRRLAAAQLDTDNRREGVRVPALDRGRVWMLSAAGRVLDELASVRRPSPSDVAFANILLAYPFFDHVDAQDAALLDRVAAVLEEGHPGRLGLAEALFRFQHPARRGNDAGSLLALRGVMVGRSAGERLVWSVMACMEANHAPVPDANALRVGVVEALEGVDLTLAHHLRAVAASSAFPGGVSPGVDPVAAWLRAAGAVAPGLAACVDEQLAALGPMNISLHRVYPVYEEILSAVDPSTDAGGLRFARDLWLERARATLTYGPSARASLEAVVAEADRLDGRSLWMASRVRAAAEHYRTPISVMLTGNVRRGGVVSVPAAEGMVDPVGWRAAWGALQAQPSERRSARRLRLVSQAHRRVSA